MCIISKAVKDVSQTNILVAVDKKGKRQMIVYSNKVDNQSKNNAMILPVPNPHTLVFHNLKEYPTIFEDCQKMIRRNIGRSSDFDSKCKQTVINSRDTLKVFSVGSYEVSVAMSLDDLKRVDTNVFESTLGCETFLKNEYSDPIFGFIICKLNDNENKTYHPFGYSHNIHEDKIFIPTKHYHSHNGLTSEMQKYVKRIYGDMTTEMWSHSIYLYNVKGLLNSKCEPWGRWTGENRIKQDQIDFPLGKLEHFEKYYIVNYHPNIDLYSTSVIKKKSLTKKINANFIENIINAKGQEENEVEENKTQNLSCADLLMEDIIRSEKIRNTSNQNIETYKGFRDDTEKETETKDTEIIVIPETQPFLQNNSNSRKYCIIS